MPNQKVYIQILIFVNLYQHAKNDAVSSICSGEMIDLKILQTEWLVAFWLLSQEQDFSRKHSIYAGTANSTNFHYRANSGKINDQYFL